MYNETNISTLRNEVVKKWQKLIEARISVTERRSGDH